MQPDLRSIGFYHALFMCSGTTETICFFLALRTQDGRRKVCKFDFANPSHINCSHSSDANHLITSVTPIDDNNVIACGFNTNVDPNKFIFYSSNHSSTNVNWAIEANTFGMYLVKITIIYEFIMSL